jgi:hypothetical protein
MQSTGSIGFAVEIGQNRERESLVGAQLSVLGDISPVNGKYRGAAFFERVGVIAHRHEFANVHGIVVAGAAIEHKQCRSAGNSIGQGRGELSFMVGQGERGDPIAAFHL